MGCQILPQGTESLALDAGSLMCLLLNVKQLRWRKQYLEIFCREPSSRTLQRNICNEYSIHGFEG